MKNYSNQTVEFYTIVVHTVHTCILAPIQVKWNPPTMGWFKLNTYGSSVENPNKVGGGLIRNSNGVWIDGFAWSIGKATSVLTELLAFRDGLRLAVSLGLNSVIIDLDTLSVVSFLNNSVNIHPYFFPLMDDCRSLLWRIPHYLIQHVFREANRSVDTLAA